MADACRLLPAGDGAIMVELAGLDQTLALADGLRKAAIAGVTDLIPAARTVLIRFDPAIVSGATIAALVAEVELSRAAGRAGHVFEIPVVYDGEDLDSVARTLGWSVETLIARHSQATFTVAFTGFAPGFAYMVSDDPELNVPRHSSPRTRIPAGSVALAGAFGGIYPSDSPGGWQLLGTTPLAMWDTGRQRAALLAPGDTVRFCQIPEAHVAGLRVPAAVEAPAAGLVVTRADRPALFQDHGRGGHADQGVSRSGALDRGALHLANLCVGNPADSAAIEINYGGLALRADRPITVAVAGAPTPLSIKTETGERTGAPFQQPFALDAGDELVLDPPASGVVSYLAIRGGFEAEQVLGSASTDTLARLGPAPIVAGSVLVPAHRPAWAVQPGPHAPLPLGSTVGTVILDVLPGPRADWFEDQAIALLLSQDWAVTPDSSRIGMRLAGELPLTRKVPGELASEGTVAGAIQVPHNGQPLVFLADHPLTGGYPVIAVVAAHHHDLAGQVPIGSRLRFRSVLPLQSGSRE